MWTFYPSQANEPAVAASDPAPVAPAGIGALGQIEPRSRVLRVSHNAGPEGAKIDQLLVDEAQDVEAGQVLAILADYPIKEAEIDRLSASIDALKARLRVETIGYTYALKEQKRRKNLLGNQAISQSEMEESDQAAQQASAQIADIKAQIKSTEAQKRVAQENLANMTIKAPIAGTVLRVMARAGERLDNNGLLEIADLSQLDVVAEIYERDMPRVTMGQKATIQLVGMDTSFHGTVRELGFQVSGNDLNDTDPLADRDQRVIPVRITLDEAAIQALRHQIYRQVQVTITP